MGDGGRVGTARGAQNRAAGRSPADANVDFHDAVIRASLSLARAPQVAVWKVKIG